MEFDYDKECERMREKNEKYIDEFVADLNKAGLSPKTIERHRSNVDFYINQYLFTYDVLEMEEGCRKLDDFFGYYFITKCMWSTPGAIKSTAASFKKFYKCMLANGHIKKESYNELCYTVKEEMEDWQATCAAYDDPSAEDPFDFFF